MIEVDVFWSFAIGAFLAAFAGNLLVSEPSYSRNDYFVYNVIFLGTLFAPSGAYLLWKFPYWETMYVFLNRESMHALLPTLFASTNVLLGVLGFRYAHMRIRAGSLADAHALWVQAYAVMFGILGFGYRRFLYAGDGEDWAAQKEYPLTAFFSSEVFYTLLAMGVAILPALFYGPFVWMAHPANANLRSFPLVGHVASVVAPFTVAGVVAYFLFILSRTDADRAYYVDGPTGYWAPAVAFVVAESIFVAIVAGLYALAQAFLPTPKPERVQ